MSEINVTKIENEADSSAVEINRKATDGTIVDLQKDGSSVGSIGTSGGDIYVGTSDAGIKFGDGIDSIQPWNTSTNALRDNAIDLGRSSGRFKDLYLSGGVYLGGAGAANYLDDYEEGVHVTTMTPSVSGSITLSGADQELRYTKIGNIVHVTGLLTVSSVSSPVGFIIMTLPFTAIAQGGGGTGYFPAGNVIPVGLTTGNIADFVSQVNNASSTLGIYFGDSISVQSDSANAVQSGTNFRVSVTYETSS